MMLYSTVAVLPDRRSEDNLPHVKLTATARLRSYNLQFRSSPLTLQAELSFLNSHHDSCSHRHRSARAEKPHSGPNQRIEPRPNYVRVKIELECGPLYVLKSCGVTLYSLRSMERFGACCMHLPARCIRYELQIWDVKSIWYEEVGQA